MASDVERRPIWIIAFAVGALALGAAAVTNAGTASGVVTLLAALAMIADLMQRRALMLIVGSAGALFLLVGGVYCLVATWHFEHAMDLERSLEEEGFTDIQLVPIGDDVMSFEARRDGDRCTGEIRLGPPARRAIQCASAEPLDGIERDCESGDLERCAEAAARVRSEPPIDWPRATRSSLYACEGGLARECLYVGMARELGGRGLPQDVHAAALDYARACEAGAQSACARAAALPASVPAP